MIVFLIVTVATIIQSNVTTADKIAGYKVYRITEMKRKRERMKRAIFRQNITTDIQ
jgi:hypothetical protein